MTDIPLRFSPYDEYLPEELAERLSEYRVLAITLLAIGIAVFIIRALIGRKKRKLVRLAEESPYISVRDFLAGAKKVQDDCPGCYIIQNMTNHKFYVGQSHRIISRVTAHFTGHGNGDVYADFVKGDRFRVKLVSSEDAGYKNLNPMERELIKQYRAYRRGYNKTRGNQ